MEEKKKSRKELIKTFAIIFLAILLVLTFFSNTIMNYSLPEVSAQYCYSGELTNKVRGNGIVETSDPYSLVFKETRVVDSVKVKVGDEVEKGDVLYLLKEGESTELAQAEKELKELKSSYEKTIITGGISSEITSTVEKGNIGSLEKNQLKIENAQKKVDNLESSIESLNKTISALESSTDTLTVEKNKKDAQKLLTSYEESLSAWISQHEINTSDLVEKETILEASIQAVSDLEAELAKAISYPQDISSNDPGAYIEYLNEALTEAKASKDLAQTDYDSISASVNTSLQKITEYTNLVNSAKANLEAIETNSDDSTYSDALKLADARKKLETAQTNKTKAEEELSEIMADLATEYGLEEQLEAIKEKEEEVDKLKEEAAGLEITAPVSGTVLAMNYVAGETIEAGSQVTSIQKSGKGFTLTMDITTDQAKLVTVGDEAEITNSWWYSDVQARVIQIRPDPNNPQTGKKLVFELEGDVVAGQSLTLTVGRRTSNYDFIVPTSAVREDNNGKFVLRVESKSTPLGNRYMAERVDVVVLASDDTQSAVSGDFTGWDYIITNSTKPVEAGTQVRLKD